MSATVPRAAKPLAIRLAAGAAAVALLLMAAVDASGQELTIPGLRTGEGLTDTQPLQDQNPERPSLREPLLPEEAAPGAAVPDATPQAAPTAPSEDAEEPAARAQVPSFDLFEGPSTNAPAGRLTTLGPLRPEATALQADDGRTGAGGSGAVDQGATTSDALRPLGAEQAGTAAIDGFLPSNPPLSPGVAGETLGTDSQLRSNQRLQAAQQLFRRAPTDPFAPVGIRVGRFILYPELIQTLGASTNVDDTPKATSGVFSETTLSSRLLSDWASNEAEFNSALTYRRNFSGDYRDEPAATADGRYRFDIDRLTTATLRGAVDYRRQQPGDIDAVFEGAGNRPDVLNLSGSGQVAREFGRLTVTGTGSVARTAYSDLPAGSLDQNLTTLTASLRTGYELSPAIAPFVEASLGRRIYDVSQTGGTASVERNSLIPSARLGVALNLAEKLLGEVAVGYAVNRPDDASVGSSGSPTIDANLVWSPRRDIDVTLTARSSFSPDSSGRSTTIDYDTSLGLRYAMTARTDLTARLAALYSDSDQASSDELLLTGEAGFNYWLNRYAAVTGLYSHRQNVSDQIGRNYTSDTVQLGLRLQR